MLKLALLRSAVTVTYIERTQSPPMQHHGIKGCSMPVMYRYVSKNILCASLAMHQSAIAPGLSKRVASLVHTSKLLLRIVACASALTSSDVIHRKQKINKYAHQSKILVIVLVFCT